MSEVLRRSTKASLAADTAVEATKDVARAVNAALRCADDLSSKKEDLAALVDKIADSVRVAKAAIEESLQATCTLCVQNDRITSMVDDIASALRKE